MSESIQKQMLEEYKQLDIFSFIKPQAEEPPILLIEGQEVFLVDKADIKKYVVCADSWICGENNRGYRLVNERGIYDCTWNNRILAQEIFMDYENAMMKADKYLQSHDGVILAKGIKPISTVAYSCEKYYDNKTRMAFYCDLGNDMYYVKEFMSYHHIIKGRKAVKRFMEQQEFKEDNPKQIYGFLPSLKNMYKCTEQSDWDYAECEYVYAVG